MAFDWDEGNITHIARHGVEPHEAEQAYDSNPLYLDYAVEDGEVRHREVGETAAGRVLVIVSIVRNDLIRIVTAYTPERSLHIAYLHLKESEQNGKKNHS